MGVGIRSLSGAFLFFYVALAFGVEEKGWHRCTFLDGDGTYQLCWRLDRSDPENPVIEFEAEVMCHGYVAFGLSPNGGMAGSDIVVGWVKYGAVYFQDRHGKGNFIPEVDSHADWVLLSGSENDIFTTLRFRRKLDSCDPEDIHIDDSTMRVIYAYSEEDPESEEEIEYHREKRGTKSMLLLQSETRNYAAVDNAALRHWDVLSPNFTISSSFTSMYWCRIYKTPELEEKNHIVMVEPVIHPGSEAYVHHILLYECVGASTDEYDPHVHLEGHRCHHPNMPDAMKKCEGVFLAWGVGGEELILPEHVGLPLDPSSPKYYMMEIHYDNPSRHDGAVDRSGLRIHYTRQLRNFDAGTLMIGATVTPRVFVPPALRAYVVSGHSNPSCLDPVLPQNGLKVLGAFLHAHLLGRALKARHFRGREELVPLAEDNNYDFNYQDYRYFKEEVDFLHGDQITVECTYDSTGRNSTTFGGESTEEEMCLAFLLYYPRIERFASVSVPKYDVINKVLGTNFSTPWNLRDSLSNFDWKSLDVKKVEEELRYGQHDTHCYLGNGDKNSITTSVSYPADFREFKRRSSCSRGEDVTTCNSGSWPMHPLAFGMLYFRVVATMLLMFTWRSI